MGPPPTARVYRELRESLCGMSSLKKAYLISILHHVHCLSDISGRLNMTFFYLLAMLILIYQHASKVLRMLHYLSTSLRKYNVY